MLQTAEEWGGGAERQGDKVMQEGEKNKKLDWNSEEGHERAR